MEKLKQVHIQTLSDTKDQFQEQSLRAQSGIEENFTKSKDFECAQLNRTITDLENRVQEKMEEIRELRRVLENDNVKSTYITNEIEHYKGDVIEWKGK